MNRIKLTLVLVTSTFLSGTIGPVSVHAQAADPAIEQATTVAAINASSKETLAWETVLASNNIEDHFAFIETYPDSAHIKDAKLRIIDLLWVELEVNETAPATPADEPVVVVAQDTPVEPEITTALPTGEIELRSFDGLVSVVGIITAYDDALITIKTSFGTVGIENDGIGCIGATCPSALLAAP